MTQRGWLRLILYGGVFGAVAGAVPVTRFEGDAVATWLARTIAVGLLAGALAAALLYAFRKAPAVARRWVAWPVAGGAGGALFFGGLLIAFAELNDWRMALLLAGIWTLGWLCFLWRPALL